MREEILTWLNSKRDFYAGLTLYQKYGKNKGFLRIIQDKPKFAGKLAYELAKLVNISMQDYLAGKIPKIRSEKDKGATASSEDTLKKHQLPPAGDMKKTDTGYRDMIIDDQHYPVEVRRVLHEFKDLYTKRALLHKKLRNMPFDNTPKFIAGRKKISDEMKVLSDRMDILWEAREKWEKDNILPDMKKLFPERKEKKPKSNGIEIIEMDGASLMKRKKNLESSLAKDRNLLKYQNKVKQEKEIQMPPGPKRDKIEKRINDKEDELEKINKFLNSK